MRRHWKPMRPCGRSCDGTTGKAMTSFSRVWRGNRGLPSYRHADIRECETGGHQAAWRVSDILRVDGNHRSARNTFITSSPRWLITFTAIRPDLGLSNAREVSLCNVAQASSLTSAFSVVLRALYGSLAPRK